MLPLSSVARRMFVVSGIAVFSALVSPSATAATLFGYWNFDSPRSQGPNYNQSAPAVTGVTASSVTAGSGFAGGSYGTGFDTVYGVGGSTDRAYVFETAFVGNNQAGALSGNDTFTFTITPTGGQTINLTSISFYAWSRVDPGAGNAYNFFVTSSATGTDVLGTYSSRNNVASNSIPTSQNNQYTLDLSSIPELSGVTTAVTFTIGAYYTGVSGNNLRFDDLRMYGDVIPEPSAAALSALGLIPLLRRRR
ncbi:MAG: hypothetical protein KF712_17895 [Akkermansiaceae bacterium]|nr:hypothetical protein [Akkermansiaceae bacterium]